MRLKPATHAALLAAAFAMPVAAQGAPDLKPPEPVAEPAIVPSGGEPHESVAPGGHPMTREDVSAWLDGFLPFAMARADIPGAVVVVVKDGEVLVQKGYGYSDVAKKTPVDPELTLFRPGSVSKLLTWTAVMQQVEAGKIDLDADVNGYLDYKIPPRDGPPITMRNLMTHTPGFDEVQRALIVTEKEQLLQLGQALKRWVPPRVEPAGGVPSYSNYGAALAGYIVERVSGMPFDDYIDKKILEPLSMTHSTFRQPLPEAMVPLMSKGYSPGEDEEKPYEMIGLSPAGSLAASGADMAKFMIAHLQKGAYAGNRILEEATAVQMHGTAAVTIPPLQTMMLGFYQADQNGHRGIAHGGDTQWFHSDLNLFVDDGAGVFVSFNSPGIEGAAQPIRAALVERFADRYLPGSRDDSALAAIDDKTAAEHTALVAGRYIFSRRSHKTFTAALNLLSQATVAAGEDGTITVPMLKGLNGRPKKFKEISPFVWKDVDGEERLAAKVENGRIVRVGYDPYPFMQFEPSPWWASAGWLLPMWVAGLVVLLLTVLAWPISALVRRHYRVPYALSGLDATAHRRVRVASLVVLLAMVAIAGIFMLISSDFKWAAPGIEHWVTAVRLFTLVAVVFGAVTALWNAAVVLRSSRRWPAKVWSVVLAVSCVTMLWVGVVFKMVGISGEF
jgi:CubicO group peptidase (beta-lactamase class C family)